MPLKLLVEVTPEVLLPHATTVPVLFRAMLQALPPVACVTPDVPLGTVHCPNTFQPQHVTIPVLRTAIVW
jgi:hypothetical protein